MAKFELTECGKLLKKLQIDNDETSTKMAERIGISSSYLSLMLHGRPIPAWVIRRVSSIYKLSEAERKVLENAALNQAHNLKISLDRCDADVAKKLIYLASEIDKRKLVDSATFKLLLSSMSKYGKAKK